METLNKLYLELSTLVTPDVKTRRELALEEESLERAKECASLAERLLEVEGRLGEVNLALAAQKEQLAHLERTKTLAIYLLKAIEATHSCESFKGMWTLAQVHGMEYNGPTYKKERAALEKEVFA